MSVLFGILLLVRGDGGLAALFIPPQLYDAKERAKRRIAVKRLKGRRIATAVGGYRKSAGRSVVRRCGSRVGTLHRFAVHDLHLLFGKPIEIED